MPVIFIDPSIPINVRKFYKRLQAGEVMNFNINISDQDVLRMYGSVFGMLGEAVEKYNEGYKDEGFEILVDAVMLLANYVAKMFESIKANMGAEYTAIENNDSDNIVDDWLYVKINEIVEKLNVETSNTSYEYSS